MDLNCTQDNNYAGLLEDSTQDQGGSNEGTPFADLHLSQDYDNIRDPLIDLVSTKDTNVFLTTFPHGQLGESTTPIKVQKKEKRSIFNSKKKNVETVVNTILPRMGNLLRIKCLKCKHVVACMNARVLIWRKENVYLIDFGVAESGLHN